MWGRALVSLISIVAFWTLFDGVAHRIVLAPLYARTPQLWRPLDQMNVALISVVTVILAAFFIATFGLLVQPKSLETGLTFGALAGIALGVGSGFGTYIHSPISLPLAWGWAVAGWLRAVGAGAIVGLLIR